MAQAVDPCRIGTTLDIGMGCVCECAFLEKHRWGMGGGLRPGMREIGGNGMHHKRSGMTNSALCKKKIP